MIERVTVHHYFNRDIGWLELRTSSKGVRSISYMAGKSAPSSGASPCQDPIMAQLVNELDSYFSGELKTFTVPLDPSGTSFQRSVWEELFRIPYGTTRSYGQVARSLGNARAARAVGSANHCNPIPILVPCHRVISSDGSIGGYASGLDIKRALLNLEGVEF